MLSRVAGSLYQMGALVERADHTARVVDVHLTMALDRGRPLEPEHWSRVLELLELPDATDQETAVATAVFDVDGPSLRRAVQDARREAMAVRPVLSTDVYDSLNALYGPVAVASPEDNLHDLSMDVQRGAAMIAGVIDETMDHDEAWEFIRLGRQLARARNVTRLVTRKLDWLSDTLDAVEWAAVLRSCSAFESYRWRLSTAVDALGVTRFLLLDRTLPRSARMAVSQALASARAIDVGGEPSEPHRLLGRLSGLFEYTLAQQVVDDPGGFAGAYEALHRHLAHSLVATYFRPTRMPAGAHVTAPPIWARPPEMQQQQ